MARLRDVFTPTKPARLTFVERESVNDRIVSALRTPGRQAVVYGHTGCGKTTLLENKLNQLYEGHVTTRCMKTTTFQEMLLDAFDQLDQFYPAETHRTRGTAVDSGIHAQYLGVKAELGSSRTEGNGSTAKRILPPQLTPQNLARFLGAASRCWVLEDFHKADPGEKQLLAQSMKVFMDTADAFPDVKIIAVGAVDSAREVIQYDAEMTNRIAEIHVPLMSGEELRKIIEKGQRHLNFKLAAKVKPDIVDYSNGLASVCHHLCLNILLWPVFSLRDEKKYGILWL
jgi:superfamily I DNA and RNA helicase